MSSVATRTSATILIACLARVTILGSAKVIKDPGELSLWSVHDFQKEAPKGYFQMRKLQHIEIHVSAESRLADELLAVARSATGDSVVIGLEVWTEAGSEETGYWWSSFPHVEWETIGQEWVGTTRVVENADGHLEHGRMELRPVLPV